MFWYVYNIVNNECFNRIPIVKDVNECAYNNGGCSHECVNMAGTYRCECPPGYTLHSNGHSCVIDGKYVYSY